jgi:hypothetical protein
MLKEHFPIGRRAAAVLALSLGLAALAPSCSREPEHSSDLSATGTSTNGAPASGQEGEPNGRGSAPAVGPNMTYQQPPITDVGSIVSNANPTALLTQPVQLSRVKVQRVLNPEYVLVGPDPQHTVIVRLKERMPQIQANAELEVSGVITQIGEDLSQWNLNDDEKKLVPKGGVFINAIKVMVVR